MRREPHWVLVPLSRPGNLGRVLANVRRQSQRVKLCIVENGAAQGTCARHNFTPDLLCTSEPSAAIARNVGMDAIRAAGGGWFSLFDDDDYYGPNYIAEVQEYTRFADVVGKQRHFVRLEGGLHLFQSGAEMSKVDQLHGACISSQSEDCVYFPDVVPGDDAAWCKIMASSGANMWTTSKWNYVYRRLDGPHVWKASDVLARRAMGPSIILDEPDEFVDEPKGVYHGTFCPMPTDAEIFAEMRSML